MLGTHPGAQNLDTFHSTGFTGLMASLPYGRCFAIPLPEFSIHAFRFIKSPPNASLDVLMGIKPKVCLVLRHVPRKGDKVIPLLQLALTYTEHLDLPLGT